MNYYNYIRSIKSSEIINTSYNEYENTSEKIMGFREKSFVNISCEVFSDLINELRNNPKCCYETTINNWVKDGNIPLYISVLKRKFRSKNDIDYIIESSASKTLNFFECKTAYDTILKFDDGIYSCSVNFKNSNEKINIIGNFKGGINLGRIDLKDNISFLKKLLNQWNNEENFLNFSNSFNEIIEDYIYSFLIRRYVLLDCDCWFNNFGIIRNIDNNTIRLAPNFDFERCFDFNVYLIMRKEYENSFKSDIQFVEQYYPNIFKKFSTKFKIFRNKNIINNIIAANIPETSKKQNFLLNYYTHIDNISRIIKETININEK